MKPIALIFSILTFLAFNSYSQDKDVKQLLDNEETRTAIFTAIADNHELMIDFMKAARENEHGAMMIQNTENHLMEKMESKKGGMIEMKGNHQMMGMMKDNPEMMHQMMGNMMDMCEKDSVMRSQMANMMTEHSEMMKMCMQKMKEKGMMHSDGKMMNIQENSNHNNHNH